MKGINVSNALVDLCCCLHASQWCLWWKRWRQLGPLKCWYCTVTLHNVTTHKMSTWISEQFHTQSY